MNRFLYRCLLWLHPPAFRREYAGEMLWIFDEALPAKGPRPLFVDAFSSLARQWLLRSGSWKIAAALSLALLQVVTGGAAMLFLGRRQVSRLSHSLSLFQPPLKHTPITVEVLLFLTVFIVGSLILTVLVAVTSHNQISRRRRSCSNFAR